VLKTHKRVHGELHRLIRDDPQIDAELRSFLPRSYDLKTISDYDARPGAAVSGERASQALLEAKRFVATFAA
jgi:uncharacterized protein (UPF0332 family)